MALLIKPPSISDDAINIPSALVAHALYIPRKGLFISRLE